MITALTSNPISVEVRQMWKGGPLRKWSPTKSSTTPDSYKVGFVGSYVCARCQQPCDGVYPVRALTKWLCGPCKKNCQLPEGVA
jgi:hypothetical protein